MHFMVRVAVHSQEVQLHGRSYAQQVQHATAGMHNIGILQGRALHLWG